jgi:hypothetical protein
MSTAEATIRHLPPRAARLVAVEVLLADPDALDDDVLESCLYVPRETARLMTAGGADLQERVSRLEAWVETLMRNLSGLALETVLCELDEARGAYDEERGEE